MHQVQEQLQALGRFKAVLKPGYGTVLVRDYAVGDLAEQRLAAEGRQKRLGEHFYVRGDGTRCLYFCEVRAPARVAAEPLAGSPATGHFGSQAFDCTELLAVPGSLCCGL